MGKTPRFNVGADRCVRPGKKPKLTSIHNTSILRINIKIAGENNEIHHKKHRPPLYYYRVIDGKEIALLIKQNDTQRSE